MKKRRKKILSTIIKLSKPTKIKKAALIIVLFSFLTFFYFHNLKSHPFHLDEWAFVRKGYYFDLFFVSRNLKDPRWYVKDSPDQPKLGPYIYGLTLHLSGIDDIETTFKNIKFNVPEAGKSEKEQWWFQWMHQRLENLPLEMVQKVQLIISGRRVSILFTLTAFVALFSLGTNIKGFLLGSISTFLLGLNTLMFTFGSRAMTDSMQLFFFFANLLLVLLYLKAIKNKNNQKIALLSIALGINCALGVGVKVSGILILVFLAIFFLGLFILQTLAKKPLAPLILSFLIVITSFFTLFVSFHPYLYQNTLRNFISMFTNRLAGSDEYRLALPGLAVYSRWQAVKLIARQTLSPTFGPFVNFRIGKLPVDVVLFITGLWYLGEQAFADFFSRKKISGEVILITWTSVVIVSLIFYLKNNWPRFYLPTVSCITIIQAYAITTLLQELWPLFLNKLRNPKD